jgi:type II secretory ATPase GspE/PulE/Tfp pilus assembly ATPase PilB-like protein
MNSQDLNSATANVPHEPHSESSVPSEERVRVKRSALSAELAELLTVVDPASLVNVILQRGFAHGATDIHFDPTPAGVRVRFRIDGALQDIVPIPHDTAVHMLSRIKIMAGMDIADRRLPQDGHIAAGQQEGMPRDIRVGSCLTLYGERLVLRLMPDSAMFVSPDTLGLTTRQTKTVSELLRAPYGLLLVVGPVGCGKTTTVYSFLSRLNQPDKSVVTIEDPVERRLHGANQIQVDPRTGLQFSTALRGILRQDPNIISIGEIRDAETAQIACRAATTGVLVLSTLHANSPASAVDVLRNFGISSMTIADCLRGVIAQRLVRTIAEDSKEEYVATADECRLLNVPVEESSRLSRGIPTQANFHSGYRGRTAVFETMQITSALRDAIYGAQPAYAIRERAIEDGMESIEECARQLVLAGKTSTNELQRLMHESQINNIEA